MGDWGIVAIYASFFASLPLFFVKRERARRNLFYTSLFLLIAGLATSITVFLRPPYQGIAVSHYVQSLMWHAGYLKKFLSPAIIALLFITAANAATKRRIVSRLPPNQSDLKTLIRLQKSNPMFGILQIIAIVFASLFGILMLVFAREVVIERYRNGPPVNLPEVSYGAIVCSTCEVMMISVGPNGEISTRNKTMLPEELEWTLAEKIKDNPRMKDWFINAEEEIYRDEFVTDIGIHLRVDANCPFEKLHPVLQILERRKIRWAYFRVTEE